MEKLLELNIELMRLLDIEEESDSGKLFRPNVIISCRALDADKLNRILLMIKEIVNHSKENKNVSKN
jgi:hypothetical protein